MHPDFADPDRRRAIHALFDLAWPGIAAKIATAARMGWDWSEVSTPFVRFDGDRALSHVGVLDLPVVLGGEACDVAGIHAVCTDPEHRRRGHFRAVMEEALDFVDARRATAKLNTGQPHLYEPFGFRRVEQCRYVVARSGAGGGPARALGEDDLPWMRDVLSRRVPLSSRYTAMDGGWLLGIDEVLWTGGLRHLHAVGDLLVAWEVDGHALQVYDVAGSRVPDLDEILAASPWPFERVVLWMEPGALADRVETAPWPDDDVLMVRGRWPVEGPVAVSPLASH